MWFTIFFGGNMDKRKLCVESYNRLRNLKLVGTEVGIPWQSVYVELKKAGVSVCGDKKAYGSVKDKLAARFEARFRKCVPFAVDNNSAEYQAKIDFFVGEISVDVKCSNLQPAGRDPSGKTFSGRWAYCISKQKHTADFFVMYALGDNEIVRHVFLIPREIAITATTISIPESMNSKWADYEVNESELADFFRGLM